MNIYYENPDPKDQNEQEKPGLQEKKEIEVENNDKNNKKSKKKFVIPIVIILLGIIGYLSYLIYFINNSNEEKNPFCFANNNTDIYEQYKNSIVMIKHRYGVQIRIANHEPIILEDYDIPNFETFATGFFVDSEGHIVTNKHVVSEPENYPEEIAAEIKNLQIKISAHLPKDTDPSLYKDYIYRIIREGSINIEEPEPEKITIEQDSALDDFLDNIEPTVIEYFSKDDISIEPISLNIQVMLHDTGEWLSTSISKVSENWNIDLALIQLESKETPATVTNYVELAYSETDDSTIKPGTKAIMLGFPLGMNLANTDEGTIKAQMYEGDINKESDGTKFQYSIPAAAGASGAPVFNACGQLIAVNYSGYEKQGYNFGIIAKHINEIVPIVFAEEVDVAVDSTLVIVH